MPAVKCTTCNLTISYSCDKVATLLGFNEFVTGNEEEKTDPDPPKERVLTLQCFDGHRNNYENLCEA